MLHKNKLLLPTDKIHHSDTFSISITRGNMGERKIAMLTNNVSRNCINEGEEEERSLQIDLVKPHKVEGNGQHVWRFQAVFVIYEALLRTDDWSPKAREGKHSALLSTAGWDELTVLGVQRLGYGSRPELQVS